MTGELRDPTDSEVGESIAVAAIVALARNVNVLLRGGKLTQSEKERLIRDGAVSAGVSGFISLLIG